MRREDNLVTNLPESSSSRIPARTERREETSAIQVHFGDIRTCTDVNEEVAEVDPLVRTERL